ncbi:MAG: Rrf2 family transcriptional regulator [Bacteroidota bacterium]
MLSKKTKYALNALLHLARKPEAGPCLTAEIAAAERIPQKFLENILLTLRNAGILQSRKGRGGGYSLLKQPSEVPLADVMRLFQGPIAMIKCVSRNYYERCEECRDEQVCGIRNVMQEVHAHTLMVLENTTLQQLIERESKLISDLPS